MIYNLLKHISMRTRLILYHADTCPASLVLARGSLVTFKIQRGGGGQVNISAYLLIPMTGVIHFTGVINYWVFLLSSLSLTVEGSCSHTPTVVCS